MFAFENLKRREEVFVGKFTSYLKREQKLRCHSIEGPNCKASSPKKYDVISFPVKHLGVLRTRFKMCCAF